MSPTTAAKFMRFAAIMSLLSALLFATGAMQDPTGILSRFLAIIIPGSEGVSGIATPEARVGFAIAGGVFAGFMVMLYMITAPAIERGDKVTIRASIAALLVWFVVDSGASIAGGAPLNALSNFAFLLFLLLPLIWIRKQDAGQNS
ncbi:MAG: hypothetical protein ABJF89_09375 [Parasphingorhabdus sp.]|uniref:hypothetical protein n=2 Tax=Parasphingorhabdus sp. TaxID=2709688 RepID=UPI00326496EE